MYTEKTSFEQVGFTPQHPEESWTGNCSKQCAIIYLIDNLTIGDRRLIAFLIDLCEQHGIAYQRNIGGGTDASAIQRTKEGALSTTIGAPVRYMHSTVQLCHEDDIEATVALLTVFLAHAHELLA